jgi:hypothetical protein
MHEINPLSPNNLQSIVPSDVVRGDLNSPRNTLLDTTRPSTIFYQLHLN